MKRNSILKKTNLANAVSSKAGYVSGSKGFSLYVGQNTGGIKYNLRHLMQEYQQVILHILF